MATIQRIYPRVPQKGYPGRLAKPNAPHYIEQFPLTVPVGGTAGKPGYLLKVNNNGTVEVCDAADDDDRSIGILMPDLTDVVRARLTSVPHNSPQNLEFEDGDVVNVLIDGVSWGVSGGALMAGQQLVWDHTNFKWTQATAKFVLSSGANRIYTAMSAVAAADELFPVYASGFWQAITT